ncbi:MAG: T9SS type A sorting domain-containing protein [Candidatus Kapabacteria bacterium]|nr:T9SS type A sorting domain-containing protein [Candidatus Kapabacteria bacterium]
MRKQLMFALGVAFAISIFANLQQVKADVYAQFTAIQLVTGVSYQELDPAKDTYLQPAQFGLPPNYFWGTGYDDGYYYLAFKPGFVYSYNDKPYSACWISVNGFISFEEPTYDVLATKNSKNLFFAASNFPKTVVAPFWGDHYYRSTLDKNQGYIVSRISYQYQNNDSILVIQWKDLNINDAATKSSTGNFQLRLYKSTNQYSSQGDIEFCYGSIGNSSGTTVVTRGASVGINGSVEMFNGRIDFLNGLRYGQAIDVARTDDSTLTDKWTPSIYNDNRIRFTALVRQNAPESWGDGDADLSKVLGNKHYGLPQNRYVTMNDVATILRSVAKTIPLDSLLGRAAYHGDVNHTGRYFWKDSIIGGLLKKYKFAIYWKDKAYTDNLPTGITSEKQIYFQVNEYDAATIMDYMAARVITLPWIYDTSTYRGKITPTEDLANGIKLGDIKVLDNGLYQIPVKLNGYINGPIAAKFVVNGELVDVTGSKGIMFDFDANQVTFAGTGEFTSSDNIIYLTVKANKVFTVSEIRFNDVETNNVLQLGLTETEPTAKELVTVTVDNNGKAIINVNATEDGFYSLNIYDIEGNVVRNLSTMMKAGINNFDVDGLMNGAYIIALSGNSSNVSKKMVIAK